MSDLPLLSHTFENSPGSTPILFLHGFMGSQNDWLEVIDRLNGRCSTVTVDLPGHGRTAEALPAESYGMPETAALIINLLDRLQIERCYLVGYSMGGRLGLYLLINFPERFRAAVIESGSPGLRTEAERTERRAHDADLARQIMTGGLPAFLEQWYSQPLFGTIDRTDPKFAAMLKQRGELDPVGLARSLEYMGTGAQPSLWPQLEDMKTPTLFVAGENDRKFSDLAFEMASLCLSSRTGIIPSAGHNVHYERPDEFVALIAKFLKENA